MKPLYEDIVALEWPTGHGGRHEKLMKINIETNWIEREVGEEKSSVKYLGGII